MPSANWALRAIDTRGADLALRQIIPWGTSGEVVPLTISSTFAPIQGAVANLLDDTASECVFAARDLAAPGFAIHIEFPAPVDLRGFRFRKSAAQVGINRHSISMGEQSCTLGSVLFDGGDLSRAPEAPLNFATDTGRWIEQTAVGARGWVGCAIQGNFIVVGHFGGYVYYSRDGGESWITLTAAGSRLWNCCAISADGKTAIASCSEAGVKPWMSTNGGATWSQIAAAPSGRWDVSAVSADGKVLLIAGGTGYAYLSKDGGATWVSQTAAGSRQWRGAAVSGDGQTLLLADYATNGYVYLSKDGGATWVAQTAAGSRQWRGAAVSGDGQTLVLAPDTPAGLLVISRDGGATWGAQTSGSGSWYSCCISHDGSTILAADYGNKRLMLSVDAGISWTQAAGGVLAWYGCAVSADGSIAVGATNPSGAIWIGYLGDGAYGEPAVASGAVLLFVQRGLDPASGSNVSKVFARNALDTEFGGQGRIYGTVELYVQAGNIPLPRRVRLHRSRDGMLVRETWSDAQGNYSFDHISERYTYDVIAWDHEGLQQSVVANDLTPEVMP